MAIEDHLDVVRLQARPGLSSNGAERLPSTGVRRQHSLTSDAAERRRRGRRRRRRGLASPTTHSQTVKKVFEPAQMSSKRSASRPTRRRKQPSSS